MRINTSQISMDASAEHKDVTGRFTQILFPDWHKERGLASVAARSERNSPA